MSAFEISVLQFVGLCVAVRLLTLLVGEERFFNAVLMRRFRLALVMGYIAFGDKTVALATVAPSFRRSLWVERRRPRLLRRAALIESLIGC